jgi:hypothetical protein
MRYDPEVAPDPVEWLATPEEDRLAAVQRHHQSTRHDIGSPRVHAAIHAVVETQLAERHPAATDAMSRLVADGLRQHEALHAIGSVVAAEMFDIAKAKRTHDPEAYSRRLQDLTATAWRTGDSE